MRIDSVDKHLRIIRNEDSIYYYQVIKDRPMPNAKRVLYTIRADVLERFNSKVRPSQRSKTIERMMLEALQQREDEVVDAAMAIARDPESSEDHQTLSAWVDAQSAHTLADFES